MKFKLQSKVLVIAAGMVLAAPAGVAQSVSKTGPKYDMANEVKIKGVVEEVRDVPGDLEGTRLVVKTDTKTVLVYAAPGAFLKEIDTAFNKGDQVDVTGAKAPNAAEETILAREITVGTNTFTLRDDKGIPVWAGWKSPKASNK
jgi:hypothetical protein